MIRTLDEFNYRIFVGGDGVSVKAWHYEVPHDDEHAFSAKVDPRDEEANPSDVEQMLRLAVRRVNIEIDKAQTMAREAL